MLSSLATTVLTPRKKPWWCDRGRCKGGGQVWCSPVERREGSGAVPHRPTRALAHPVDAGQVDVRREERREVRRVPVPQ